jgi:hypothetical protein
MKFETALRIVRKSEGWVIARRDNAPTVTFQPNTSSGFMELSKIPYLSDSDIMTQDWWLFQASNNRRLTSEEVMDLTID